LKVLFVSHSSQLGGAENILCHLLKGLPKDRFECSCVLPVPGPLEDRIKALGVQTHVSELRWWLGLRGANHPLAFCAGLAGRVDRLREIIARTGADVVFTSTIAVGEGAMAARAAGLPHVWHVHEILSRDATLVPPVDLGLFYSTLGLLSDRIVAESAAVKSELEEYATGQLPPVTVIHNAVEVESGISAGGEPGSKTVLAAGNICPRKGTMEFLEAASLVSKTVPGADFMVVGRVTEKEYYKRLLAERKRLGMEDQFKFVEFQSDISSFFDRCRLLVLPSISEPFGMVILEAMNACRPVVATLSGGPKEIVEDGTTGFLVSPGNATEMAEKITRLLQDPELAARMGRAGYERVKDHFSVGVFAGRFADVLTEVHADGAGEPDSSAWVENLARVFETFGGQGMKMQSALRLYERVTRSLPYKLYRKLGWAETPAKRLLRLDGSS